MRGGAQASDVASLFTQHMMVMLSTFRRMRHEDEQFSTRGRFPKTNHLRRSLSATESVYVMEVVKLITPSVATPDSSVAPTSAPTHGILQPAPWRSLGC